MDHLRAFESDYISETNDRFWKIEITEYFKKTQYTPPIKPEEYEILKSKGFDIKKAWTSNWYYLLGKAEIYIDCLPDDYYAVQIERKHFAFGKSIFEYFMCDEIEGLINCIKYLHTTEKNRKPSFTFSPD